MKRIGLILMAIFLVAYPMFSQIINVPADYPSIQAAINAASNGDTVLVDEGSYIENINFRGKAITVASRFILDGDTSHVSRTIIDGSEPVYPDSGSTVTMLLARDTTAVLCGLTIQGGSGTGPYPYSLDGQITIYKGGGIIHAGGKIINNIIRDNHVSHIKVVAGGGIEGGEVKDIESDTGVNMVVRDNIIFGNSLHAEEHYAGGAGMAANVNSRYSIIENNEIYGNVSTTDAPYKAFGGGMLLTRLTSSTGTAIMRNNYIHDNEVHSELSFGGGLFYILFRDTPLNTFRPTEIYNNVISNNHSDYRGGGACLWYLGYWDLKPPVDPVFMNNTLVNNSAVTGSGLYVIDSEVAAFNNIFWNELPVEGGSEISSELFSNCGPSPAWCRNENFGIINASYNSVQAGWPGEGNMNCSPYLKEDTFQLSDSSICVGRGVASLQIGDRWFYAPPTDFNGNVRPDGFDSHVDMGALESNHEPVLLADANLSYIGCYSETLSPEFDKDILEYELFVADTVTSSAALQAFAADKLSDVDVNYSADLSSENKADRTTSITVTSSDSTIQKTYAVLFQLLSTDAELSDLTLTQGTLEPAFDPGTFTYEVTLPAGTAVPPEISCETSNEDASYRVINATDVNSVLQSLRTSRVVVTSEYGEPFVTTYSIVLDVLTGIKDYQNAGELRVFPNPANTLLTVEISFSDHYSIEITSMNGQKIFSEEMEGTSHQIDLSSFPKGVYFITIRSEGFISTKKIIKL